ncbi:hypothetical protein AC1031_011422 [Aphanomyces cochlioides]|nr:hypothetical protein AC1031_011422 [Aphanomyces cochlioides]
MNGFLNAEQFIACNRTLGRQSVERNAKDKTFLRDTEKWNEEYALWNKDKNGEMTKTEFLSYCQQSFGGKIKVVLKFMRNEGDYIPEIESRKFLRGAMSVELMLSLPLAIFQQNAKSLTLHGGIHMKNYPNVLVMTAADRSLEDIFLKVRPTENAIRGMLEEVAKHLAEIHDHGLVHGDVKKLNVLRVQNHVLKFIDFDAATPIGQPMGYKFSSGVLPTEMFCKLETKEAVASHKAYWQGQMHDLQQWKKLKLREKYVVRSFRPENTSQLPYSLVNASPAIDMWSFGCMVYQMLSGVELLPTDVNQDMVTGRIKLAATWTDEQLKARIEANMSDEQGQDLAHRLLVCDPEMRLSAKEVLNHPYFTSIVDNSDILNAVESIEKSTRLIEETIEAISLEVTKSRELTNDAADKMKSDIKQATAVVTTSLFEASEVTVPTSFVPTVTFDVIARGMKNKQIPVKQVRGAALRELKRFLDEKDPEHTFAGLERTLTDQGRIQWTIKQEDSEGHDQILEDIRQVFFRDSNFP